MPAEQQLAASAVPAGEKVMTGAGYIAPETIDEALALLAEHGDDAKILAGGQSLLVLKRWGLIQPRLLIGLRRITALQRIEPSPAGGVTIGAMVTEHALASSRLIQERYTALAEAAASVATPAVRRQATIGGNLAHADPAADPPGALIALGAELELASPRGRRRVPVDAFFTGFLETALEPGELLIAIHLPPVPARGGSAYCKHRVRGTDYAIAGVGMGLTLAEDGETCLDARIGLVAAGATPLRATEAEAVLRNQPVTDETLRRAGNVAAETCDPPDDTEASAWYRRQMISVFVRRAGEIARERARGQRG